MYYSPAAPLYDPRHEHDACGIGFVAHLDGQPRHSIVQQALEALGNLQHRGATDADGRSGDGAGVLTQLPHAFFAAYLQSVRVAAPAVGDLAVAVCFLPLAKVSECRTLIEEQLLAAGVPLLAWRAVPTNDGYLGNQAMLLKPMLMHIIVQRPEHCSGAAWERRLFLLRRAIGITAHERGLGDLYLASWSSRTIIYKGLMQAGQLGNFYPDLTDPLFTSNFAVYHQRFSTNTFPSWERAQPFRIVCHNGEINTLSGNLAAIKAREPDFASPVWGDDVAQLRPVADERGSDSAMLDNVLELLVQSGRGVEHALSMLVPPAWEHDATLAPDVRAFWRYHRCLLAPWDGPAALCFAHDDRVGLALDRNGLRPARFIITDDGLIVAGSEVGAVHVAPERIIRKGRIGPGQMLLVDLGRGVVVENEELKASLAAAAPYEAWLASHLRALEPQPDAAPAYPTGDALLRLQAAFGYDAETLQAVLKPMARDAHEPIGSMGDDTALALLAQHGRPLYNYFRQRFAQVTNPPLDPLRERLVMSLSMTLGRIRNLLSETPEHAHLLEIKRPILQAAELAALLHHPDPAFAARSVPMLWPVANGAAGLHHAVIRLQRAVVSAARAGIAIVVLDDRGVDASNAPIPALLAVGAAHHALVQAGVRTRTSLVVDSAEPREIHHMACLLGYGAEAIHPRGALATVRAIATEERSRTPLTPDAAEANYINALDEGLRKILGKLGIATLDSYHGAQLFEALGVAEEVVDVAFRGTPTRIGGIGWREIAEDVASWHALAWEERPVLPMPGAYKWKKEGEYHAFQPPVVHALHAVVGLRATHETPAQAFQTYAALVHERPPTALRDLLRWRERPAVPLSEVEPISAILRRFSTAAMSVGATSPEAHEVLAMAIQRLGGMANSGEGGEDPQRYGDDRNSAIKQVASGRFGVTPAYLMSARELQIKMAQGSKPGEGGQLPGHKVTPYIAQLRNTLPGITLISPPPHHDIYSIEDLAQLIVDLRQINPQAAISVKLVSAVGVGTIAAGVVKAGADVVLISGHCGGTGASPLSSIKNVGVSWELGLAETQQTLLLNGLRARVRLRVDGGLQTGRDVITAALLGADEYSWGTAAVVAAGCVMARACHNNTCPVGIATQRPELRAKFPGTVEGVMQFFVALAEHVRTLLASIGARSLDEIIGQTGWLEQLPPSRLTLPTAHDADTFTHDRTDLLRLDALLASPALPGELRRWGGTHLPHALGALNAHICADAAPLLETGGTLVAHYPIRNTDRTVGITLAGVLTQRPQSAPAFGCDLAFTGNAGQSWGAWATTGMRLTLDGDANDYVGKGLGGGTLVVRPALMTDQSCEQMIIGNTALYGATAGQVWLAGRAGERFAVRNSGASAVVEGIGDHGCEYMTGGVVAVLGPIGRNFAAGMSGGRAFVWDADGTAHAHINLDMVHAAQLEEAQGRELRALLEQHIALTGSRHAHRLLEQWETSQGEFWIISPKTLGDAGNAAVLEMQPKREAVLVDARR